MRTRALPVSLSTQTFGARVVWDIEDLFPNLRDVGANIDEPAQASAGHVVEALVDSFAGDGMSRANTLSASSGCYFCDVSAPVGRQANRGGGRDPCIGIDVEAGGSDVGSGYGRSDG